MKILKCLGKTIWYALLALLFIYVAVSIIYGAWLVCHGGSFGDFFLGFAWPAMAVMIWVMAKAG